MPIFRGQRIFRQSKANRANTSDPLDMSFDEYHRQMSKGRGGHGFLWFKEDKSPYGSEYQLNYARTQHEKARAEKAKKERGLTVEEEYG